LKLLARQVRHIQKAQAGADTKGMKTLIAVAFLALSGCASSSPIQIDSEPRGYHVEINGDYVGKTPVNMDLVRKKGFIFGKRREARVRVYKGSCVDLKIIRKGEDTPATMNFDMSECPVTPKPASSSSGAAASPSPAN
jgi:hypothetical protein